MLAPERHRLSLSRATQASRIRLRSRSEWTISERAWAETPYFSARERAALAFTEAVTLVADDHVPSEAFDAVAEHFTPDEIAALISLIVAINAWNAVSVSTRAWVPGSYEP